MRKFCIHSFGVLETHLHVPSMLYCVNTFEERVTSNRQLSFQLCTYIAQKFDSIKVKVCANIGELQLIAVYCEYVIIVDSCFVFILSELSDFW